MLTKSQIKATVFQCIAALSVLTLTLPSQSWLIFTVQSPVNKTWGLADAFCKPCLVDNLYMLVEFPYGLLLSDFASERHWRSATNQFIDCHGCLLKVLHATNGVLHVLCRNLSSKAGWRVKHINQMDNTRKAHRLNLQFAIE